MEYVWSQLGMSHEKEILMVLSSAREVVEAVMEMKEDKRLKCCLILWLCWSERNRVREGENCRGSAWLVHSVMVRLADHSKQEEGGAMRPCLTVRKWEKPASDYVKVNSDAAFDMETWNGGWGCVLRDSDGDVIEARRGRIEALLNPLQGEMIACIHGVQAAIDAGVGHVVIESDAVAVVQAVYSSTYDLSTITHLVEELRSLLYLNFISWVVQQRPRSCNRVAHELASLGSSCDPAEEPVLESIPAHILYLIADDSTSFQ
jgi:ribonuclease HI